MVGVLSPPLLVAVAVPEEATVAKEESEWFGVCPACIVRRSISLAARTWSVCSFFARGLLVWSEFVGERLEGEAPDGEGPDLLDVPDPSWDLVAVKLDFTLVALSRIPSNSGWISCTSTTGMGPLSSSGFKKSGVGALDPFGDLGPGIAEETLPFLWASLSLCTPGRELPCEDREPLGLMREDPFVPR